MRDTYTLKHNRELRLGVFCLTLLCLYSCSQDSTLVSYVVLSVSVDQGSTSPCPIGYTRERDACEIDVDLDRDLDGVPDAVDNCVNLANPRQEDCDADQIGNLCDEDQSCGVFMGGYVKRFEVGQMSSSAYPYVSLEIDGVPSYGLADEFGQYNLENLPEGQHRIFVYPPFSIDNIDFAPESRFQQPPIGVFNLEIPENQNNTPLLRDLLIKPTGNLGGRVDLKASSSSRVNHEDVGVYIEELPNLKAVSDRFGYFLITGIPEGTYTLRLLKSAYEPVERSVEVVGLVTTNLIEESGRIELSEDLEPAPWLHEIEAQVANPTDDVVQVEVILEPLFPHQTDPIQLTLSNYEEASTSWSFTSERLSHAPHDVFHVSVLDESIIGSRATNIYAPPSEMTVTHLQALSYSSAPYSIRDQDRDGLVEDDPDIDSDGYPNDEDDYPTSRHLYRSPSAQPPATEMDLHDKRSFSRPLFGQWLIQLDKVDSTLSEIIEYSQRVPRFFGRGEIARTLVDPLIFRFGGEDMPEDHIEIFSVDALVSLDLDELTFIVTSTECTPLNTESDLCQPYKVLLECELVNEGAQQRCGATLEVPVSSTRNEYFAWVYSGALPDRLPDGEKLCQSCFYSGELAVDPVLSFYGLLSSHLPSENPTLCGATMNPEDTDRLLSICLDSDRVVIENCTPDRIISDRGPPFLITQVEISDPLTPSRSPDVDLEELSYDRSAPLLQMNEESRVLIKYRATDGEQLIDTELTLGARTPVGDELCWGPLDDQVEGPDMTSPALFSFDPINDQRVLRGRELVIEFTIEPEDGGDEINIIFDIESSDRLIIPPSAVIIGEPEVGLYRLKVTPTEIGSAEITITARAENLSDERRSNLPLSHTFRVESFANFASWRDIYQWRDQDTQVVSDFTIDDVGHLIMTGSFERGEPTVNPRSWIKSYDFEERSPLDDPIIWSIEFDSSKSTGVEVFSDLSSVIVVESEAPLSGAPSIHLRSLSPEGNVIGVDRQIDDSENEKISLFDIDGLGDQTLAIGYSKSIIEEDQEIVSLHVMRKNSAGRNLFDREIVSGPSQEKIEGGAVLISGAETYVSFSSNFNNGTLQTNRDAHLLMIDESGELTEVDVLSSDADDTIEALIKDELGNLYVCGKTAASPSNGITNEDVYIAKYDAENNLVWARPFGTARNEACATMDLSPRGTIYIGGTWTDNGAFIQSINPQQGARINQFRLNPPNGDLYIRPIKLKHYGFDLIVVGNTNVAIGQNPDIEDGEVSSWAIRLNESVNPYGE